MEAYKLSFEPKENRDRRTGLERRVYAYAYHIPERRVTPDRRFQDAVASAAEAFSTRPAGKVIKLSEKKARNARSASTAA